MPLYDDLLNVGPYQKVETFNGRGGRKIMITREKTKTELKAHIEMLTDEIGKYAERVEYLLNRFGMTPDQLDSAIRELHRDPKYRTRTGDPDPDPDRPQDRPQGAPDPAGSQDTEHAA